MKKVISMSLYGTDRKYLMGAVHNSKLAKEYFPNWEYRVYHENGLNQDILNMLSENGTNLINMGNTNVVGSMWRFYVYDDPQVDYFICRDVDDRLNQHDADIVQTWLFSGFPFHIVRSFHGHRSEIMAGIWGGKTKSLPHFNMGDAIRMFNPHGAKDEDQRFLREVVFPKIKNISLTHGYDFTNSPNRLDFPRKIYDEIIGWAYPIGEVYDADVERSKFE